MKLVVRTLVVVLSLVLVTACATSEQRAQTEAVGNTQIEFIDLDSFDMSMTRDLQRKVDLVVVRFPNQPITINQLPDRLQKWLNAVHKHGQGFTIENKDGYAQKDIIILVSALVSGYKLVKSNMPSFVGRKYKAVITLKNADGVVEKIDFIRF